MIVLVVAVAALPSFALVAAIAALLALVALIVDTEWSFFHEEKRLSLVERGFSREDKAAGRPERKIA